MKLIIYNKDRTKYYSLSFRHDFIREEPNVVWVESESNEGMTFKLDEIFDVIYNELERHFVENF
jgi:hypothetical protein